MAESFANASSRAIGVTSSVTTASIGAQATTITNISTFNVNAGMLVDHPNFIGGTRVKSVDVASNFGTSGQITVDQTSSNTTALTSQIVGFHTVTSIDTPTEKSILVGGTLSNNTTGQVRASVILSQHNNEHINIIHDAPIPEGSSLVISDGGKLVVGIGSTISVSTNTDNALDVSLSFLRGVS
jgi:hypothetical protein